MNAAIVAGANWGGKATLSNTAGGVSGVYDHDENFVSGAMTKSLTCSGMVAPADLMNSAQQATVGPNGGLVHSTVTPDAATNAAGVVLTKIQIVTGTKAGVLHREPTFAAF